MDTKPRVGMLIGRFYPKEAGAEIQCRRLSQELIRNDHAVFVLTQALRDMPAADTIDTIPVHRIGLPLNGRFASLTYVARGFFWLWKRRDSFDILHAHMASSPAVLAGLAGKALGKPTLLKLAGSRATGDIATSRATWYGTMKLSLIRGTVSHFVCPSLEIRQELLTAGFPDSRITVMENGVDTALFAPPSQDEKTALRRKLGMPDGSVAALYTGRLEPGKGLDILLRAWSDLEKALPGTQLRLFIVGAGSLENELRQQAAGARSVVFCGWKEDVQEYLKAGDIFVLPSLGEGLPNSLLEAMSCGLACVATNIGGIRDLIARDKSGILVEPGDAAALSAAIAQFCRDGKLRERCGAEASSFIRSRLSLAAISARYSALYRTLTGEHSS